MMQLLQILKSTAITQRSQHTSSCNKVLNNEIDDNNKNDDENTDEEEQDIDVQSPVKIRSLYKVFGIGNILSKVVSHFSIVEIIKLRGINKLFNNELEFGFECYKFDIFFKYKNKYIIDIIRNAYYCSMSQFMSLYLEMLNAKQYEFVISKDIVQ